MADYYVDPAMTGGANDGGSDGAALDPTDSANWTDAWLSLQSAADTATASDTVFCRGTQTLTAPIDFDTNQGGFGGGFIKFVGCAADGTIDGTTFKLDGDSAAVNCIRDNGAVITNIWLENIECYSATGAGVLWTVGNVWMLINVISHTNGTHGFDASNGSMDHATFIKCRAYGNTDDGFALGSGTYNCFFLLCSAYDNSDCGFKYGIYTNYVYCVAHDNGSDAGDSGFNFWTSSNTINCVANSEVAGIFATNDSGRSIATRLINCTTGIDFNDQRITCGWNVFANNTNDRTNPTVWDWEGVFSVYVTNESTTNTNKDDPDGATDDGMTDASNKDFNLEAGKTYSGDGSDTVGLNIGS